MASTNKAQDCAVEICALLYQRCVHQGGDSAGGLKMSRRLDAFERDEIAKIIERYLTEET